MDCINQLGLSQTTLASIAKRAEISQGVVIFHFQNKDNLLEEVLETLSQEYRSIWQLAIKEAGDQPQKKLKALIDAVFKPSICNRRKISIWYAFWGESRSRPKYLKLCGELDQQFSQALLSICIEIDKTQPASLNAQTAALSIESMIDGIVAEFSYWRTRF